MAQQHDVQQDEVAAAMDRLYEQHVVPLEKDHAGEYVVVSPKGEYVLGIKPYDVLYAAEQQFGPGNYVFKVGEVAAVDLRWMG